MKLESGWCSGNLENASTGQDRKNDVWIERKGKKRVAVIKKPIVASPAAP
jgi:hypothetical protein